MYILGYIVVVYCISLRRGASVNEYYYYYYYDCNGYRETAIERAETVGSTSTIVVYSDDSGCEGYLGAATVALDKDLQAVESKQIQVGPMDRWSVHVAELIGIFYAVSTVFKISHQWPSTEHNGTTTATILCDSKTALQAIENPGNKSGQRIIHAILQAAAKVQANGIALRLQWIPGHCDDPGNDAADRLAKDAATPSKTHPFRPYRSARIESNRTFGRFDSIRFELILKITIRTNSDSRPIRIRFEDRELFCSKASLGRRSITLLFSRIASNQHLI
jgi:ribonuclease HI